jgi:hypothetical protein
MIGKVNNAMHGTYHAIRAKHLPRYLAEFPYRFNHRYHLPNLIPTFLSMAVRTPPMPQRLLTMVEVRWSSISGKQTGTAGYRSCHRSL